MPESRLAGATIAAKATLALARVVARSFAEHHPGVPFFVLLADDVDGYFDPAVEPYQLLSLDELGESEPEHFRFRLAQQPLSYAATPFLIEALLDRGFDRVLFVKQESLVLGELASEVEALPAGGVALTPHLLAPLHDAGAEERELNILLSGVFNVGFVGVAAGPGARRLLAWWQERLRTHCRHAVADGMHYEQRWFDLAPAYFDNVEILRDPAINVAHWNLPERRVTVSDGGVRVDGRPGRLFRFSGYELERPHKATRYSPRVDTRELGDARLVFDRYRQALLDEGARETAAWPYAYARFDNTVAIPDIARELHTDLEDPGRFGDPFATSGDSYFTWLRQPADGACGPNKVWQAIYERRRDLQVAFPEPFGEDREAFLRWAHDAGATEHGIPPELQ